MKSRLTQLFHPGKSSRALTGLLLAVAFAVTGLSACRGGEDNSSLPPQRTEGKDGSVAVSLMEGTAFTPTRVGTDLDSADREVTTADISRTLANAVLPDGTEVLFYISLSGDKYGAYIPAGTERLIRFTEESNVYTDGYDISLYENVLGQSGFLLQVQAIPGNVLGNDDEFLHPGGGQLFGLSHQRRYGTAAIATTEFRDDTEGTAIAAPLGDL